MSRTLRQVVRRLALAGGLVLAVLAVNFMLIHAAPGDPAMVIAGEMGGADEAAMAEIRKAYGLDQPLPVQFATYITRSLQGDLGRSYLLNQPVRDLILARLGPTILLVFTALVVAILVGTLLGVLASRKPDSLFSGAVTVLSLVGYAMPVFWTAILLVILFGKIWPILPIAGMRDVRLYGDWWVTTLDVLHHLILPAIVLGTIPLAVIARMTRSAMLEVLREDYIRTARAKGLSPTRVVFVHGLRNALIPVLTVFGLQVGALLAGAVLTETIFSWPGIGKWLIEAIGARDYPVVQNGILLIACLVILVNFTVDILYGLANPRIRHQK